MKNLTFKHVMPFFPKELTPLNVKMTNSIYSSFFLVTSLCGRQEKSSDFTRDLKI